MKRSLVVLMFIVALLNAEGYTLGSGIKVPDIPLYAGGYISADYTGRNDNYNRLRIDDIAFIAYGDSENFSYLGELEFKEIYIREWGKRKRQSTDKRLNIERLYLDYAYSDRVEFRIGKFNTPVGYWNLTPISVLRDSASNPYLSYVLYPRYLTGIQTSYENHINNGNIYTITIQNNNDLDDEYNNIFVNSHAIAGVEHIGYNISLKANAGYFHTVSGDDYYYFLLSGLYEKELYKITTEYGARKSKSKWTVPYAFYVQGVYHAGVKHDLIARFESYKIDEGAYHHKEIGIIGYTYRPVYSMAYKIEYQLRSYTKESQIKLSFSILF